MQASLACVAWPDSKVGQDNPGRVAGTAFALRLGFVHTRIVTPAAGFHFAVSTRLRQPISSKVASPRFPIHLTAS